MRRPVAAALLFLGMLFAPGRAEAVDAAAGVIDGTSLGYLGCVQSFPSHAVTCFVATRVGDGVDLTAMTGGYLKRDPSAGRIVRATLPAGALTLRTATTPKALIFSADLPEIGKVDITIAYQRTSPNTTNLGCHVYPVHFVLTAGADLGGFGGLMTTSGTVGGETVVSLLEDCDATVIQPAYGAWSLDTV